MTLNISILQGGLDWIHCREGFVHNPSLYSFSLISCLKMMIVVGAEDSLDDIQLELGKFIAD